MRSIEIINNQIASLKEQAQIEKEQKTGNEVYCEIEIEQYNQVLKDLEVLEKQDKILKALKPYIELSSDGIISCHNLILIPYYKDYEEQYNLLKEWLDGEEK